MTQNNGFKPSRNKPTIQYDRTFRHFMASTNLKEGRAFALG